MHAVKLLLPVDGSHSAARVLNLVARYRGHALIGSVALKAAAASEVPVLLVK